MIVGFAVVLRLILRLTLRLDVLRLLLRTTVLLPLRAVVLLLRAWVTDLLTMDSCCGSTVGIPVILSLGTVLLFVATGLSKRSNFETGRLVTWSCLGMDTFP